jgi:hypothetical protein
MKNLFKERLTTTRLLDNDEEEEASGEEAGEA